MIQALIMFLSKIFFFSSYVKSGHSFPPPLEEKEEKEYYEKMINGDMEAREILIRHNLRLVAHVAKKYQSAGEIDDLISVGTIGLIKGLQSYKNGKGTQLSTYCAKCVDNEILMYIRANKRHKNDLSLSDSVGVDKDGNEITLMDVIPAEEGKSIEKIEDKLIVEKVKKIIDKILDKREKEIIYLRYGLNGEEPMTQFEVADVLHISRSYVSRLEKKTLEKIAKELH